VANSSTKSANVIRSGSAPKRRPTTASTSASRTTGSVAPSQRIAVSVGRIVSPDASPKKALAAAYAGMVSSATPGALFEYIRPSTTATSSIIEGPKRGATALISIVPCSTTAAAMAQRVNSFGEGKCG
jgi:hypothetical protein